MLINHVYPICIIKWKDRQMMWKWVQLSRRADVFKRARISKSGGRLASSCDSGWIPSPRAMSTAREHRQRLFKCVFYQGYYFLFQPFIPRGSWMVSRAGGGARHKTGPRSAIVNGATFRTGLPCPPQGAFKPATGTFSEIKIWKRSLSSLVACWDTTEGSRPQAIYVKRKKGAETGLSTCWLQRNLPGFTSAEQIFYSPCVRVCVCLKGGHRKRCHWADL